MEEIKEIADLYYRQGESISAIAQFTCHDRKTIRQCLTDKRWVTTPPAIAAHKATKITPYKKIIDEWLEGDRKARRKQ